MQIPLIISEISKINTRAKIDYTEFNLYNGRINEFEYLKTKWREIHSFGKSEEILKKIKNIFDPFFTIKKAFFDDVGHLIFKFVLIADKPGLLINENELGIKILIKNKNESTINEIKKNNLIYEKKSKIDIRINDTIIFYFSIQK